MARPTSEKFDLATTTIGLLRGGEALRIENAPGPPTRVDGYTVGCPRVTGDAPHGGEMHPDGDELLCLVSGRVDVELEDGSETRRVELLAGEAIVVPRGVWHRVRVREPSQLFHVTPGPGAEHRPLPR